LLKDLPLHSKKERVLLLAGSGLPQVGDWLRQRQHIEPVACDTLVELCGEPPERAGLVVVAEEAMAGFDPADLRHWLEAQATWSDIAIVFIAIGPDGRNAVEALGNVSRLEPPLAMAPFLSLVDCLLRARGHQRRGREMERYLAACEARFKALFDNLAVGVAEIGRNGRVLSGNARLRETFGIERRSIAGIDLMARIHPDDHALYRGVLNAVFEGRADARTAELRRTRRDGTNLWLRITAERAPALRADDPHCLLLVEDVSARKEAEGLRRTLLRELSHRVKNTLAIIQALAKQTARTTGSKEDFLAAFEGRVASLASTHSLLTDSDWAGIELRALIETELRKDAGDHAGELRLSGRGLLLSPSAATTVGMVLHELATNALRHGALSVPGGVVAVDWDVVAEGGAEMLHLVWRERNGPSVRPPQAEGFGMRLVRSSAKAQVRYTDDGLEAEIAFLL
jgi:PAS domain S-box-containing protein